MNDNKNRLFEGLGVALATPFGKDGEIDYDSLGNMVRHCMAGGTDYLVVSGTTGESVTLSSDEQERIVRHVAAQSEGKARIVIGIGGNDTADVIRTIRHTDFTGISGILSVAPYYNKPAQKGVTAHFKAIAAQSPVPVILYNIPGRTGINMTAETTLELAQEKNIAGIKEASGMLSQIMAIIAGRPSDFAVISGDDSLTLPLIALGGNGVISVAANAFPRQMSMLVKEALAGRMEQARAMHYELLPLFEAQMADGNPAGIKAALHLLGKAENILRLPLVPVSPQTYKRIECIIQQILSSDFNT
ncbi:MAG: 4-hydroxy-tetrahydrodipicolinate synthase [Bacteroidales bacterium]|jgi:4-hydroxy-tetrahydrodipicolinate synthase|nr:4-hydroxy-tetrahydrodipicolinate synthase [Bacteroidales bacterium]